MGCPRMTPDSSMTTSSLATVVEGDAPPAGPVEAAGSPMDIAPTMTFVSPSGDTSRAGDPSSVTTSSDAALTVMAALETGTPSPLAVPIVGPLEP
jgi:hypothetical protein